MKSGKSAVVLGYYGFDNLGDELILHCLLKEKSKQFDRLIVLSADPKRTLSLHQDFFRITNHESRITSIVQRWNPFSVLWSLLGADVLIVGGGGLFQDATSSLSLVYYLGVMACGLALGKEVQVERVGVGPVTNKIHQQILAKIFQKTASLNVRDSLSRQQLISWGVKRDIGLKKDYVLDWEEPLPEGSGKSSQKAAVILKAPRQLPPFFIPQLQEVFSQLRQKGYELLFLPFHKGPDASFSQTVAPEAKMMRWESLGQVFSILSEVRFVISMRFHGLVLASLLKKPCAAWGEDQKILGTWGERGQKDFKLFPVDQWDVESFLEFVKCIEKA